MTTSFSKPDGPLSLARCTSPMPPAAMRCKRRYLPKRDGSPLIEGKAYERGRKQSKNRQGGRFLACGQVFPDAEAVLFFHTRGMFHEEDAIRCRYGCEPVGCTSRRDSLHLDDRPGAHDPDVYGQAHDVHARDRYVLAAI